MDKEKIYIVSWNGVSDSGGVERITYYMLQAWKDIYDVRIIDLEQIRKKNIYGRFLGKHYVLDALLVSIYINRLKDKGKVKIVTQGFNAPYVDADLYFAHGTMRGYKLAVQKDSKWHFNQYFEKRAAKRAKRIIAVGNHVKGELNELYGVNEAKITVLENCIDTDEFVPVNMEKKDTRVIRILFAGRLEIRKGLNEVIELAEYLEDKSDIELLIATNSDENVELFGRFKNTKIQVGLKRHEMNAFYNSGDVMFFPSLYEGFELVTLEALSAGIPVMGNDVGAISDLYKRGQSGVELLGGGIKESVSNMIELAMQFRNYQRKLNLHEDMVENYNFNSYIGNLRDLWRHT